MPYPKKSDYLVGYFFGIYYYVVVRFLNMVGNDGIIPK